MAERRPNFSHYFVATRRLGDRNPLVRFQGEADMKRLAKLAESVENDP
jgi:hypothetical protein